MIILIPMAGRGSRFLEQAEVNPNYLIPKPLISVLGKPMIRWAIESLPFIELPYRVSLTGWQVSLSNLIFICLSEHEEKYKISDKLRKIFSKSIRIILLDRITEGALETAYQAKKFLSDINEDIIVSDSDHYFDGLPFAEKIHNRKSDTAGIIPVDVPRDCEIKHSYSLSFDDDAIIKVAEKDPELAKQGAYSNIGAYYFSKAGIFLKYARETIDKKLKTGPAGKSEYYVAPLYQRMIDDKLKIKMALIKNAWRLGTPSDLEYFLHHFPNNTHGRTAVMKR